MKTELKEPKINFIKFNISDVITASVTPMGGNGQNPQGGYGDVTDFGGGGMGQPLQ